MCMHMQFSWFADTIRPPYLYVQKPDFNSTAQGWGGGAGILRYFHIYAGSVHFEGFQKNEYFWGYDDFVDIFCGGGGVIAKLDYIWDRFYVF